MASAKLPSAKPVPSLLKRWLREPLLHVLLIGATLFIVYDALNSGTGQRQDSSRIAITADDLAQIRLAWTLSRGDHVLAIPGTSSPRHLEENLAAGAIRLSPGQLAVLDSMEEAQS